MRVLALTLTGLIAIFSIETAMATKGNFSASLNRSSVPMGQTFQITFSIEGGNAANFRPPSFGDFRVLSGPNQSTSISMGFGAGVSKTLTISYILQPTKEGNFDIGPAFVELDGKQVESNIVTIQVVKSGTQAQPGQQQSGGDIADYVFIKMITSKQKVFQGEQLLVTYRLYTRLNISNLNISQMPAFTGFMSQEVEIPRNIAYQQEVINGVAYNAADLKKLILFPQKAGSMTIDPLELDMVVHLPAQRQFPGFFFDDFFQSYRNVQHKAISNTAKLEVVALPEAGKPVNFNGAVGKYSMEVSLDKTETETDDPITVKMKISGTGNIRMIEKPVLDLPRDLEVYDPKINEKINSGTGVMTGSKSFDFLVIPRRPGEYKLYGFSFTFFDVEKKEYITLNSPEYTIRVEGEASVASTGPVTGVTREEIQLLGEDIRHIHSQPGNLVRPGTSFFGTTGYYVALCSPLMLFFLLAFVKRRREKELGNTALIRTRQAQKMAKKRFAQARKLLTDSNEKAFYDEVTRALWGYFADKFNVPGSELSREKAGDILQERGADEAVVTQFLNTLETCEMALFAAGSKSGSRESVCKQAESVVEQIETLVK